MPSLRVLGHSFDITLPYAEGHTCSESEAAELNKLWVQRITVAARHAIKNGPLVTREDLEVIAQSYTFRSPPFALPSDPVANEAQRIATSITKEALSKAQRAVSPEDFKEMVARAARTEYVQAEARRRVEQTLRVVGEALNFDDILKEASK